MKRTLVGIGLLVAAGIGSVAMAPGGAAQSGDGVQYDLLESEIVPNPAEPGASVTFSSIDPCTFTERDDPKNEIAAPGEVAIFELDAEGNVIADLDVIDMNEDGSWSYEFNAEQTPGEYLYGAMCQNQIFEEEQGKCGLAEPEEGFEAENVAYRGPAVPMWKVDCHFQVYVAPLTVSGDEVPSPTTTAPDTPPVDTPPPATPVVTPPDFTG